MEACPMPISSEMYLSVFFKNVRCVSVAKSELAAAKTGHMQNTPARLGGWYGCDGDCRAACSPGLATPKTYGTLDTISSTSACPTAADAWYSGVSLYSLSGPRSHAWHRIAVFRMYSRAARAQLRM